VSIKFWHKNKGLVLEKVTLKSFKIAEKVLNEGFNKIIKKPIFVQLLQNFLKKIK
jgi:hypothetical protein